ncbi:MAG: hypothetical protein OXC94_10255 [Chloroflexi bacterium]|nr:hypothetical protein [Chloroflexota bacterium]
MFVIVVQIRAADPEAQARQHGVYARIAGRYPGMRYKHVMRSESDGDRYVDLMAWETQQQSEAFGVDPEYQRLRPPRSATRTVPRFLRDDNPGYYGLVAETARPGAAIARQQVVFVDARPGREGELAAAGRRLAAGAGGLAGLTSLRVLRNLGWPARHVVAVAASEAVEVAEAGPTRTAWERLAACCTAPPEWESGHLVVRWDADDPGGT